jgi:Holliday junction resolvase RusA-like endonuclease
VNRVVINAIFPGEPIAWERVSGHGTRVFKPKATRQAQAKLHRQLKMIAPTIHPNCLSRFGVQFVFSISGEKKDGDNLEKLVLDAFNKRIWLDDSQVDECQWKVKRRATVPGIHMIVYVIE